MLTACSPKIILHMQPVFQFHVKQLHYLTEDQTLVGFPSVLMSFCSLGRVTMPPWVAEQLVQT